MKINQSVLLVDLYTYNKLKIFKFKNLIFRIIKLNLRREELYILTIQKMYKLKIVFLKKIYHLKVLQYILKKY